MTLLPDQPGAEQWVPEPPTLASLRLSAPDCRGCELWRDATQVVFSAGPDTADIALVGEQPGDREDHEGKPFVGPAGRLLADAVTEAGIDRRRLYVTNAVKHFRFEERGTRRIHKNPSVEHIIACAPWLRAELDVVRPRVIVCLGASAGRSLLGRTVSITRERGRPVEGSGSDAIVFITNHPSAVLRLRGQNGFDDAFAALVGDLRRAAASAD